MKTVALKKIVFAVGIIALGACEDKTMPDPPTAYDSDFILCDSDWEEVDTVNGVCWSLFESIASDKAEAEQRCAELSGGDYRLPDAEMYIALLNNCSLSNDTDGVFDISEFDPAEYEMLKCDSCGQSVNCEAIFDPWDGDPGWTGTSSGDGTDSPLLIMDLAEGVLFEIADYESHHVNCVRDYTQF